MTVDFPFGAGTGSGGAKSRDAQCRARPRAHLPDASWCCSPCGHPYTYFGHTDPKSWLGFDFVVLPPTASSWRCSFSCRDCSCGRACAQGDRLVHLRDRCWRLGLPFADRRAHVIPIAYYAIELRQHPDISFAAFWWKTVTVGPWPSGPIWFVWVLLALDLLAALLYRLRPASARPDQPAVAGELSTRPGRFFLFLLVGHRVVYIPARDLLRCPVAGSSSEPFSIQASRILLYAAYFFVGAGIGAVHVRPGRAGRRMARLARALGSG